MKKSKRATEEITIVGRVSDMEVDGGLVIVTEDEDFLVTQNKFGRQLYNCLDEMVEATGSLTRDADNQATITVSYFASFGDDADSDDEPTDDDYSFDDDRW